MNSLKAGSVSSPGTPVATFGQRQDFWFKKRTQDY